MANWSSQTLLPKEKPTFLNGVLLNNRNMYSYKIISHEINIVLDGIFKTISDESPDGIFKPISEDLPPSSPNGIYKTIPNSTHPRVKIYGHFRVQSSFTFKSRKADLPISLFGFKKIEQGQLLYPQIFPLISQEFSHNISIGSRLHKVWSAKDTSSILMTQN